MGRSEPHRARKDKGKDVRTEAFSIQITIYRCQDLGECEVSRL